MPSSWHSAWRDPRRADGSAPRPRERQAVPRPTWAARPPPWPRRRWRWPDTSSPASGKTVLLVGAGDGRARRAAPGLRRVRPGCWSPTAPSSAPRPARPGAGRTGRALRADGGEPRGRRGGVLHRLAEGQSSPGPGWRRCSGRAAIGRSPGDLASRAMWALGAPSTGLRLRRRRHPEGGARTPRPVRKQRPGAGAGGRGGGPLPPPARSGAGAGPDPLGLADRSARPS